MSIQTLTNIHTKIHTVDENIIGAPKMLDIFWCEGNLSLFKYSDTNIELFSIASHKVIALLTNDSKS